jgi:outer membrane autotransporter protein
LNTKGNAHRHRFVFGAVGAVIGMSFSGGAAADLVTIVGGVTDLNESTGNDYRISGNATLNINDARVGWIEAGSSAININGGSVSSDSLGYAGLKLSAGVLTADNAVISSSVNVGLAVTSLQQGPVLVGSEADVSNSEIYGVGVGALVGESGSLRLSGTRVFGVYGNRTLGNGLRVNSGHLSATNGSLIRGDDAGIYISTTGGTPGEGTSPFATSWINIDGSTVQGLAGSAIKVESKRDIGSIANITIQNNSTLLAGNGNLLEVEKSSTANFTVDHSTLNGNLVADDTSTMNVTLQNGAQLTGNVVNGNNLTINSGAQWQMLGDSTVKAMNLNGGLVSFGGERFHTLSLGALSGTGTFSMGMDLDTGLGDLLEVNGQANGDFKLDIQNTGVDVVLPGLQPLQVVHTEGGDAQFSLIGGRVDLGAYSYLLEQQGNDWFIVGDGKTVSPSTQSVLALFNAAPNIWMSELSTLRSRMGEVRGSGQGGGWIRAYGNRFDATTGAGIDYKQRQNGFTFGADAPVPVSDGQLVVGVLGGYSKSDLDMSRGTTGEVDSYYVGAYGTWLSEEGYYLDGVLKLNKFHNNSKVAMSDGSKAKGDYKNTGVGGSLEFGKHIKLADDYFVEPFAQMAAVVVQGDSYSLDNGLEARNGRTQSVLGKVGSSVGRNIALKDGGVLQPYLRAAVAHEFARSNKVKVNDTRFNNDLFGSRAEVGAGVSVSLSSRLQVHADFDYMKGDHVEQPWGANVGVRLAF